MEYPKEKQKWKYSLEALPAGVSEENIHPETHYGRPAGEEVW